MSDLHSALFKQIETSRVHNQQDEPSLELDSHDHAPAVRKDSSAFRRCSSFSHLSFMKRVNRKKESAQRGKLSPPTRHDDSWDSRSVTVGTDLATGRKEKAQKDTSQDSGVVLSGWLHKTSRQKWTDGMIRMPHEPRQHRRFKLTEHSLEYNNLLQMVNVQKQLPLTSIVRIDYDETANPVAFKLVLRKTEMLLEAPNEQACIHWMKCIEREWQKWDLTFKQFSLPIQLQKNNSNAAIYLEENQDYLTTAKRLLSLNSPLLVTSPDVAEKYFSGSQKRKLSFAKLGTEPQFLNRSLSAETGTSQRQKTLWKLQGKVGLRPRLQRSIDDWNSFSDKLVSDDDNYDFSQLHEQKFVMIKYVRNGRTLPHERVFKMDLENLVIMWHQTENSKFSNLRTLLTEHIVDVREGQKSGGFDKYPYDEMENQSLSVIVEEEKQIPTLPGQKKRYAMLQSLDLICDSKIEQQLWLEKLKTFITPKSRLFSSRYAHTDPAIFVLYFLLTFIGWLITHWITMEQEALVKEDSALSFACSIVPHISNSKIHEYLVKSHQDQLEETEHTNSLRWDGFILFYNLLCGLDQPDCLLLKLFREYAKEYPMLGMTVKEFKLFLIECQQWSADDATDEKCVSLMTYYDYHHRAFKMYQASSKPFEFHLSTCLFSFCGFVSFLRSPENAVVKPEHEEIYQDMTQPLSHYFINSSHNTYLEGHQLTGRSTTDAYVRALLQGCRCLEIDCWDGPDGEPKVTHGLTLVSELMLVEVAKIINKYAFNASQYPLILSLENHCSKEQQKRMAQIFTEVFGDNLAKENLVELQNLDRLPSPHELQGKIILRGTVKSSSNEVQGTNTVLPTSPRKTQGSVSQPSHDVEMLNLAKQNSLVYTSTEQQLAENFDNKEVEECEEYLYEDLNSLIVYCRTKRINPWKWEEQKKTTVCNMFSFGESTAISRCKDHNELLACTERQLVRIYPAGSRIDSSNYSPIPMWNSGIHMVALNIQTPDDYMLLNQGKFRQNGGCGYVLKPEVMRDPSIQEYNPNIIKPLKTVAPVNLEITLLSGQHLIIPHKKTISMEIRYEAYGIPHDCEKKSFFIASNKTNPLWPQFEDAVKFEKTILMPELCLVLFAVNINVRRKLAAGTKSVLLGQNVFPLTSLNPGVRYIPLRTPGGKSTPHVGLFVKINIKKLSSQGASASGTCPPEFETPHKTFNLPAASLSCGLDEKTGDDHIVNDECNTSCRNENEIICWLKPADKGHASVGCATYQVEIHLNNGDKVVNNDAP